MTTSANKPFRDEYSSRIILFVLTVTPLLFSHHFMYGFHVPKYLLFQLMVFVLLAVTLCRKEFIIRLNLLDILVLIRLVYLVLLYFVSGRYATVFENIDILGYLTLFYLLIRIYWEQKNFREFNREISILVAGIVIVAILESVYGMSQYFGVDPFTPGGYQSYESNAVGTFGSENALGALLATGVPMALFLLIPMKNRFYKGLLIVGIGLILITLGLTISRGAWIALGIGMLFVFRPLISKVWKRISSNKFRTTGVIVLLVLLVVITLFGIYKVNPESSLGRIYIWRVSLGMVKDFPVLGVGYGNYGYHYLNYQSKFFSNPENMIYQDKAVGLKGAHSEFVHVLAETGIVGLILFISMIILFYYYASIILRQNREKKKNEVVIRCIIASILIICVHSIVDNVLHVLPIALLFYFGLAVISIEIGNAKLINQTNIMGRPLDNISFKGNVLFPIVGIILLLLNVYFITNKLNGYSLWKKGQDSVHQGQWQQGIDYYRKALDYIPDNGELQFHLGAAYSYTCKADKANELLTQSLETFNDKNIYLTLGHAYRISEEYQKAEESFKTVIGMYPQMLLPHLWLAQMHHEMGERDKSIQELHLIIDSKPKIVSDDVIAIKRDAERFLRIILNNK